MTGAFDKKSAIVKKAILEYLKNHKTNNGKKPNTIGYAKLISFLLVVLIILFLLYRLFHSK